MTRCLCRTAAILYNTQYYSFLDFKFENVKNLLGTPLPPIEAAEVSDPQTEDEACRSVQTIMSHVVHAGYGYADYLRGRSRSLRPTCRRGRFRRGSGWSSSTWCAGTPPRP